MNRFSYCALLVMMLVSACGALAPEATATPVLPTATSTPVPTNTNTPLPTDTATLEPTATPDAAATAAAQSTLAVAPVLAELDKLLEGSDVSYQDGHLLWQQTDSIIIELAGPSGSRNTIKPIADEEITAGDFVFKADVTWNATGWLFCGAVFRSEADVEDGRQYQLNFLRFSGLPAYFLDIYDGGLYQSSLADARFSDNIDIGNGATNQFAVVAQGNKFTVYFDGHEQSDFFDSGKQRAEGAFGFLAWQESGKGSCEFENGWIWSLDK